MEATEAAAPSAPSAAARPADGRPALGSESESEGELDLGPVGVSRFASDPCVEAMASFVSESREWALSVQGFLVEHCRGFDDSDENKLEWYELHQELRAMMEALLEAELGKLGVGIDDFVSRLQASPDSRVGSDLLESVLAMDDFLEFKRMMLRLKADLELASLPVDALDGFAGCQARHLNWM